MILFCECNSVRIGQNIQNEVSVKISIFADIVVYQLISRACFEQRETLKMQSFFFCRT